MPSHCFSKSMGAGLAGTLWGEGPGGAGGACVEIRADLYLEHFEGMQFDIEAALQAARAAIAFAHAHALAHVLFTARSEQEGGRCPPHAMLRLLQLGFRMGCEVVDIEASMSSTARAALLDWLRDHFSASPSPCISAILSSVHVMNPSLMLHDPYICARSLAAAAACEPVPHALKFAAVVTDAVVCARMQQQAQGSFDVPVCCVAMAGGAESISISAISRLNCATLTFCRPISASAPTAQGSSSALQPQLANYKHCKLDFVFDNIYVVQGSLLCLNYVFCSCA